MPLDWESWQKQYPAFTRSPFLSKILQPAVESAAATRPRIERSALLAAPEADRLPMLQSYLTKQTSAILGFTGENLDPTQSTSSLGLDSLMAVELKNRIEADLGVVIPMVQLLEGPSVNQLSQAVFEKLTAMSGELATQSAQASNWEEGEL
jgi:acyl carrier protein